MLCYVVVCIVLNCVVPVFSKVQTVHAYFHSDDEAPTPEMARNHGYVCETHEVLTQDGYVLSVHRLPGGRAHKLNATLTPVLLQHGLLDSSADWLIAGPDRGLGYVLADQGYDVWMGNARGNVYSRTHKTLKPDNVKFWDWTWHEMGYYDLPAVIDHILNVTGHSQIYYAGHSMGTTMFFVLCATRPEYNAKVRYMAALAPVAYMAHTTSPIRYLAGLAHSFEIIYDYFGHGQFLPRNHFIDDLLKSVCEIFKFEEKICENWLFVICGHDPNQFDEKLLPIILGHNPAGTSTKTLVHYAQEIKSDRFQQFDYGSAKNTLRYNSTKPPEYNLSLVTVPISLHYGDNDLLANPVDVEALYKGLASPVGMFLVGYKGWNHLDFLWGRDARSLVYTQVEDLFRRYSDNDASHGSIVSNNVDTPLVRQQHSSMVSNNVDTPLVRQQHARLVDINVDTPSAREKHWGFSYDDVDKPQVHYGGDDLARMLESLTVQIV